MEGKYIQAIKKLSKKRETNDPVIFSTKVSKTKSQLKSRIFEVQKEIDRIKHKTAIINDAKSKDIKIISRCDEYILFLSALSNFYKTKITFSENERKRYNDLKKLEEEVKKNYEKQKVKLNKHLNYSNKLKVEISPCNSNKMENIINNEQEAEYLLKKYKMYYQAEKRNNFSIKIQKEREKLSLIEKEVKEESEKNILLANRRKAAKVRKDSLIKQIDSFSKIFSANKKGMQDERERIIKNNEESINYIKNQKIEIKQMKNEISEINTIIECSQKMEKFISKNHAFSKNNDSDTEDESDDIFSLSLINS